jgi:hypothetical protein
MAQYQVEIISGDVTGKVSIVSASTPIQAATKVAGSRVTFRREQRQWIKVTPVGSSTSYEFVKP